MRKGTASDRPVASHCALPPSGRQHESPRRDHRRLAGLDTRIMQIQAWLDNKDGVSTAGLRAVVNDGIACCAKGALGTCGSSTAHHAASHR